MLLNKEPYPSFPNLLPDLFMTQRVFILRILLFVSASNWAGTQTISQIPVLIALLINFPPKDLEC